MLGQKLDPHDLFFEGYFILAVVVVVAIHICGTIPTITLVIVPAAHKVEWKVVQVLWSENMCVC